MVRRSRTAALAVLACLGVAALGGGTSHAQAESVTPAAEAVPGQLIVGWRFGVQPRQRSRLLQGLGVKGTNALGGIRATLVKVDPSRLGSTLARLQADPRVRYAEPNYIVLPGRRPTIPSSWSSGAWRTPVRP